MGLFSRNNDSQYAQNTAQELAAAARANDVDKLEQLINHMASEGDAATNAATIAEFQRTYRR
ncbi:hypothetical protein ACG2OD_32145 [Streptomyces sp. PDY-4]|uniref:Uncharacterized protein n=1 Tax=Streptomyces fungicidicus TaxID=68203 RepID=A0A494UQW5_9ACTN|nr:hypothetical protein [Streptomyces fungicidicus]AYL34836.1 hypothetical protein CNQ36_04990 [Streptomyces fungicidicus]